MENSLNRLCINKFHKNQVRFFAIFAIFLRFLSPKTPQVCHDGVPEGILAYFIGEILGKSFFSHFRLIACVSITSTKTKCENGAKMVRFLRKKRVLMGMKHAKLTNHLGFSQQKSQKSQFFAPFSHP